MYNEGISLTGDVLDLAVEYGLVDKRGAYFRYGETLLGQGRENAKVFLAENPAYAGRTGTSDPQGSRTSLSGRAGRR